jgi:DNA polymerase-1
MKNISMEFPGVKALKNVDFSVNDGEVHALIGANGAGKSTLMKVLGGVNKGFTGEIFIGDKKLKICNPHDAKKEGIVVVYQEVDTALIMNLTVAENIMLDYIVNDQKNIFMDWKKIRKEAKEIIEKYFESFPTVKTYFRSIVDSSKEMGYIETLLKRRRYFDYENASPMFRAAYDRESVNSVFQGSASDLIKLSMNKISKVIKEENLNAKMLLQIHDELIFEVEASQAETLGNRLREIMESIYELNIPLEASMNIGDNWGQLK